MQACSLNGPLVSAEVYAVIVILALVVWSVIWTIVRGLLESVLETLYPVEDSDRLRKAHASLAGSDGAAADAEGAEDWDDGVYL